MKRNNRDLLITSMLVLAASSAMLPMSAAAGQSLAQAQGSPRAPKGLVRPNVIYFYFDDLGYGDLGCYGQKRIKTPNIDQLAAEGIRFTRHYASFPICAPSRCALLTGRHAGHSHIRDNYEMGGFTDESEGGQMPLPDGTLTIGTLMQQNGYKTGAIGKWGLGFWNSTGNPNRQGFDYFYGYVDQAQAHNYYPSHLWENGRRIQLQNTGGSGKRPIPQDSPDVAFDKMTGAEYAIDKMEEKTMSFIRNHKDAPFFLYLPYTTPHLPLQAPKSAVQEYAGAFPDEPKYYGNKGYMPARAPYSTYAAMITYTDRIIGRIIALLKELNLADNTIVMISSDNGCSWATGGYDPAVFDSTGGLRGSKSELYEGGIRIPLIAWCPNKIPGGRTSDLLSAQYDLLATLAEITGRNEISDTDGISFLPTLLGRPNEQKKHDYLYFEFGMKGGQIAIVGDQWKGVKRKLKSKAPVWEIYDLKNDPSEGNNLADANTAQAQITTQITTHIANFENVIRREHWQPTLRDWEFIDPKFKKN